MTRRRSSRRSARSPSVTLVSRTAFCALAGVSEAELTVWEQEEFIVPADNADAAEAEPLYDSAAFRRAKLIRTLSEDLQVNLAGIGVILHLLDQKGR